MYDHLQVHLSYALVTLWKSHTKHCNSLLS